MVTTDPERLAPHCMEGIDPDFAKKVNKGDIMIVEDNFGCGSSREHAPIAIKACGVSCVIAKSFARIFFRNAINIGLPIMISPEAVEAAKNGSNAKIDTETGIIEIDGNTFKAEPFPEFINKITSIYDNQISYKLQDWGINKEDLPLLVKKCYTKDRIENFIININEDHMLKILKDIY